MVIKTADTYFKSLGKSEGIRRIDTRHLVLDKVKSDKTLRAEINHSRWIVICPYCNSSEFLWEDKLFFCSECGNEGINGETYTVIIPRKRKLLEEALLKRPIFYQHWKFPERIDDLLAENELHIKELI